MTKQLLAADPVSCGYPDVSYHGTNAWYQVMENYNRHIGILYCSKYAAFDMLQEKDRFELIYVGFNLHWEWHDLALPKLAERNKWTVEFSTGTEKIDVVENKLVKIPPRTTVVLKTNTLNLKEKIVYKKKRTAKKKNL